MKKIIDTGAVIGTEEWVVMANGKLKGLFDTKTEAQAYVTEKNLEDAKIKSVFLGGTKAVRL